MRGAPGGLSGTPAPAGLQDARNSVGGRGARCGLGRRGRSVWEAGFRPAAPQVPQKSRGKFAPARMEQTCLSSRSPCTLEIRAKSSQVRQTPSPHAHPGRAPRVEAAVGGLKPVSQGRSKASGSGGKCGGYPVLTGSRVHWEVRFSTELQLSRKLRPKVTQVTRMGRRGPATPDPVGVAFGA